MSPTKLELANQLLPDDLFSKSLATKAVAPRATVMATRARRRSQFVADSHAPSFAASCPG